ncbi:MAG TPA: SdpI family protein [Thermoanaerobaculia bacterium]
MKLAVLALFIAAVALSAAVYSRLPASVPIHWNAAGAVDDYAPKAIGAFLLPAIMLALAGVFAALPAISPSGFDIEGRSRAYRAILLIILVFMLGIHVFALLSAMNMARSTSAVIPLLVGALLVALGNYLPKVQRNFFIGIRTPWTLADEDVWFRTHRLGGVLFVVSGVLLMAAGPFVHGRVQSGFIPGVVVLVALVLVIYSFAIYRRPDAGKGEVSP